MKNYWVLAEKTPGKPATYEPADTLPPGVRIKRYGEQYYYAVEPYTVHAKPYGLKKNKPVEMIVYGVAGETLLCKFAEPDKVSLHSGYNAHAWDTVRFDQTTEGWRFVRSVVKVMKVLTSVAKKAAVERNKRERNRAAAKAREGREGTCQICEGAQIVQPTGANKGTLVLHGYQRPGYGYTVGNCFGYHRKPFEVACDALTEWVDMLKGQKASIETALATLPKLKSMMVAKSWRDEGEIEITPGHERWNHELADRKSRLESSLYGVTREIEHQSGRLEAWYKAHA